jgi:site-specific DNA-methyltransferase (adenine-specific)
MPEPMAEDHIVSWSRPGDLVFDPMCGAGTTIKMAMLNNRRYLGMEIEERHCEIARERLRLATGEHKRRLDEFLFAETDN